MPRLDGTVLNCQPRKAFEHCVGASGKISVALIPQERSRLRALLVQEKSWLRASNLQLLPGCGPRKAFGHCVGTSGTISVALLPQERSRLRALLVQERSRLRASFLQLPHTSYRACTERQTALAPIRRTLEVPTSIEGRHLRHHFGTSSHAPSNTVNIPVTITTATFLTTITLQQQ